MKKLINKGDSPLIFHIIDRLPPDGAERLLTDVLKYRSKNYDFIVICLIDGGLLVKEIEEMGVPVIILGRRGRYDITLFFRLIRCFRKYKPLAVHTHLFTADSWGRLAALFSGVPGIFTTVHSVNSWKSPLHRIVDRIFSRFTTKIIACSDEVAEVLKKSDSIPESRVISIANGVNIERISLAHPVNLQVEFDIKEISTTLIIIGRLHEAKGHIQLLTVFANIIKSNKELHLLIVGEGELENKILSKIETLDIKNNVTLTGFRMDVLSIIAACDIVVMPSLWEGLPMALLEAMALEKPIIATNVGGIPNVITDGVNGMLAEKENLKMFEDKVIQVIVNNELRKNISLKAKSTVINNYSAKNVSRRYEELYFSVEKNIYSSDEIKNKYSDS